MICVLKVVAGPATGMKCWLKQDQKITIGRVSSSDFAVPQDHHMSRNHLVVEGLESAFRIRDVGSSNGTFVNESRISVVELCFGDRIKAGTSEFSVGFEDEHSARQDSAPKPQAIVPVESNDGQNFPMRTMSAEDLEFDSEITARYNPDDRDNPAIQDDLSGGSSLVSSLVDEPSVSQPVASGALFPKIEDAARDEGCPSVEIPAAFLARFDSRSGKLVSEQTADPVDSDAGRIVDLLVNSNWDSHLSLVVNRDQIDSAESGTLDFALSTGESHALTETLYLLRNQRKEIVLEFFKRCVGKDAAICIATSEPIKNGWINNFIDMLSYPSMLYALLSNTSTAQSNIRAKELASGVQFLLFEQNNDGRLCLLHDAQA